MVWSSADFPKITWCAVGRFKKREIQEAVARAGQALKDAGVR